MILTINFQLKANVKHIASRRSMTFCTTRQTSTGKLGDHLDAMSAMFFVLTDINNQLVIKYIIDLFLMQEVIHYIMLNHILWLKLWWYYNVFCYILSHDIASCCQMVCYTILYRLHIILHGSMLTRYINLHTYIYIYVCDNMHYIMSNYTILFSYFIRLEPWYMICDELFLLTY